MNCRRADKWIDQAVDGGLPPAQKAQLEAHLEACPTCRREWEVLRAADAALRVPRPVRAPEGMLAEFRQRLAQEEAQQELRQSASRPAWPWFWPAVSFAAAGATAVLVISLNLAPSGSPFRPSDPAPQQPEMARTERTKDPGIGPPAPPAPAGSSTLPLVRKGTGSAGITPPHTPGTRQRPEPGGPQVEALQPPLGRKSDKPGTSAARVPSAPSAARSTRKNPDAKPPGDRMAMFFDRSKKAREAEVRRENTQLFGRAGANRIPAGGGRDTVERPHGTDPARELRLPQPELGPRLAARAEARTGPIALGLEVQEVQSQVLPPEFNVSPAVLTALRRDVEVRVETAPVRDALKQITEAADVVVRVDPAVQPLRVTVEQDSGPLWVALQKVAQQGQLHIVPENNHLLLRPAAPGVPAAPALAGPAGLAAPAANGGFKKEPGKPHSPAAPAKPELKMSARRSRFAAGQPDRAVWPESWGTLPERGFEPPGPEELPPAVAALPQAMDEARENNRSHNFRNNSQPPNLYQNKALEGNQAAPVQNKGRGKGK